MYVRYGKTQPFYQAILKSFHKNKWHTATNAIKMSRFLYPKSLCSLCRSPYHSYLNLGCPGSVFCSHNVAFPSMSHKHMSCGCALPVLHFLPSTGVSHLPQERTFCCWVDVPKHVYPHTSRRASGRCLHFWQLQRLSKRPYSTFMCESASSFVYIFRSEISLTTWLLAHNKCMLSFMF